jgi:uncharacterized membrane protein YebE (DUF533 family)
MKVLAKKQLNLLIHLAKADGKFDKTERDLLQGFIKEMDLPENALAEPEHAMELIELGEASGKAALLYWAIRLMHADRVIHNNEVLFCKNLAENLNISDKVIDYYLNNPLPRVSDFKNNLTKYIL